jgi:hypothetical protein
VNVSISFPRATPPPVVLSNIVEARKWGDPILYALDGMSTAPPPAGIGVGNFQETILFTEQNGFNAISTYQKMGRVELDYLQSIQRADNYTVKQKMGWLVGDAAGQTPGTIYWTKTLAWDDPLCNEFFFGTLVFGGQKVAVEVDASGAKKVYYFWAAYRKEAIYKWIPFYKIRGMRRSEMGRPVEQLLAEGKMQICTCANRSATAENVYTETLKGIVYHPVWEPYDFPSNAGNALYIAKEFCV